MTLGFMIKEPIAKVNSLTIYQWSSIIKTMVLFRDTNESNILDLSAIWNPEKCDEIKDAID